MLVRVFLAFLALAVLAFPAGADDRRGPGPSLDRVLPIIRQHIPGTFYDAEGPFYEPGGRASYRIKWMTPDGRIVWFYVDARSGRKLGDGPAISAGRGNFPDGGREWPPPSDPGGRNRWQNDGSNGGNWGGGWRGRDGHGQNLGRPFGG